MSASELVVDVDKVIDIITEKCLDKEMVDIILSLVHEKANEYTIKIDGGCILSLIMQFKEKQETVSGNFIRGYYLQANFFNEEGKGREEYNLFLGVDDEDFIDCVHEAEQTH